jgi:hypothetical protein
MSQFCNHKAIILSMKKAVILLGASALVVSAHALPVYDDFSSYGTAGTWTQVEGPPIVSYTTGAPWLGGNTAPSGESWILYTNAPPSDLYSNYYSGVAFTGYDKQNVAIVNYFGDGQPGANDTPAPNLPTGFPGPFVSGLDTRTNSVWTPGWSQTGEITPPLANYLGGVGACLQFANPVPSTIGNKVFVSFFVDIPDCTGSYGNGQSGLHGYTAGFINAAELPSLPSNQYALPGYVPGAGYASVPLMEKFQPRAKASSTSYWYPGVGDGVASANYNSVGLTTAGPAKSIHFCVMAYEWNGGVNSDLERVWIDPIASTFAATTEPFASPPLTASTFVTHTCSVALPDAGGFFFLANTQDGGATPNSGVFFNSLRIGTNWAYVTGGPQFTSVATATANVFAGHTLTLNSTAVAGGVTPTYTWYNSAGPLTIGGRFSVGPTGALTITGAQPGDADTYTLHVSTPISIANGVANSTAQTVVTVLSPVPYFNSESWSGNVFNATVTGPSGIGYHILKTTDPTSAVSTWSTVSSGTFSGAVGVDTVTDGSASGSQQFYIITVP